MAKIKCQTVRKEAMFIAREICHTLVSCVAKMTLSCFLMTVHRLVLFHPFLMITDDLKHDASSVAVFEKAAIDHARAKGVDLQAIHQWTDGCASQYTGKCHTSFANISMAETVHKAPVTMKYFETSHGKGPCDKLGGMIKRKVSNAVPHDNDLFVSSAAGMYQFCESRLAEVGESSYVSRKSKYEASSRSFKLVEQVDRTSITRAKHCLEAENYIVFQVLE